MIRIIYIKVSESEIRINKYEILLTAISNTINQLRCLILLDGFDEIQNQNLKNEILTDIENLSINSDVVSFILTCRSADFYYNISNCSIYEIKPLVDSQVKTFVHNWIKDKKKSNRLLQIIFASAYKYYALKPLTLAHLCAIYERTESIPEKPILLYKKYTELLLSDWDKQNRVKRISAFSDFDNDSKLHFLSHLAYLSKTKYDIDYFEKDKLQNIYKEICELYNLPTKEAINVINEIESHTGLFLQTGFNSFEFEHKTIQEYITSEYIVNNFSQLSEEYIYKLPNELAAALLLSDTPDNLFLNVLEKLNFYSKYNSFFDKKRTEKYLYHLQNFPALSDSEWFGRNSLPRVHPDELPINSNQYDFYNTFISRISIEKPNFSENKNLCFWLLGIYTISTLFKENSKQLELFSLNTRFYLENLFSNSFFTNAINSNIAIYSLGIDADKKNKYGQKINIKDRPLVPYILKKKENNDLPNYVYLPTKFYKNNR